MNRAALRLVVSNQAPAKAPAVMTADLLLLPVRLALLPWIAWHTYCTQAGLAACSLGPKGG